MTITTSNQCGSLRCGLASALALTVAAALATPPYASAIMLTTEVTPTPGAPGYFTYDITATIDDGYLHTFGFENGFDRAITGPILHDAGQSEFEIFSSGVSDTGFLVDPNAGLTFIPSQSDQLLAGVFSLFGGERRIDRSWTFARIVTDSPGEVRLNGAMASERWYSDGLGDRPDGRMGETVEHYFDLMLADITVGPPPELGDFPDRPAPPQPPTPPSINPPAPSPPAPEPPASEPPVIDLPVDEPPVNEPPTLTVEEYQQQLDDRNATIEQQIERLRAEQQRIAELRQQSDEEGFVPPNGYVVFRNDLIATPILLAPAYGLATDFDINSLVMFDARATSIDAAYARGGVGATLAFASSQSSLFTPEPASSCLALGLLAGWCSVGRCRRGGSR